ncbi:Immunity protein 70 [Sporobacter termitidis DSM 10068]|uniref:Immunity protein 70 n=1 Tax=Sporobacter termitidis DSM 10068 TaxID=1123282 RepID=A0A1M5USA4_9FIRM|nr:immunity 70 family protein [Sporobacter termitidis]SHH65806.1 Immunity protein 70 [Sporobacter termitidis DSM 10068]
MSVGLRVWTIWYEVGTADFFYSFLSTVSYRLESDGWGSKYPIIMQSLYDGKLEYEHVPAAAAELTNIQAALTKLAPSDVVWDIEDLSKQPPWGDKISKSITSLANYFVTSDGKDLIKVIFNAFDRARELKTDVYIE